MNLNCLPRSSFLFALKWKICDSQNKYFFKAKRDKADFFLQLYFFSKMGLTWDDFLKLTVVITNLHDSIGYFKSSQIDIKEKHRRVAAAAQRYKDFFKDLKYSDFMKVVRISLKQ